MTSLGDVFPENLALMEREKDKMTGLQAFAENVWLADGPLVRDMGFVFTTRMTIVRLSDGALWISSPVPVSFDTLEYITGLGPVRYLVAATPRHVWRLEGWHALFPEAQLWASRRNLMTLQKKRLSFAGILGDAPPDSWADDLDQLAVKGNPLLSEVLFLHRQARTVILDDLIQINPAMPGMPLRNALFRLGGVAAPHGGVPLDMRITFFNRDLARQSLAKMLSWDFDKLIIAHGACIDKDAKLFVERAFRWLVR
jgi:hypothetical protein